MVLQVTGKGDPVFSHNDNFWDEDDDKIDKAEQIFEFLDVPSFALLFKSTPNESFDFINVAEKGTAIEGLLDQCPC